MIVVNIKGHAQGSVGYHDDRTRTLFVGDGCNNSTFLFLKEYTTVPEYKEMLTNLQKEWLVIDTRFVHTYNDRKHKDLGKIFRN